MAYDVVDFQEEVIQASYDQPVVVDFWAPWCGPCRVLGPVLERLAVQGEGRWKLAKINTDQNQEVSIQYGIRGIPAVKLFVDGQVVNEFTGALPEHMVKKWLEESIPSGDKLQLEAAEAAMNAGQLDMAREILRSLLSSDPNNPILRVRMAQVTAHESFSKAAGLVEGIEITDSSLFQVVESIRTLARAETIAQNDTTLPDEAGKEEYVSALKAVHDKKWDEAIQQFIEVIQKNRYYDDDGSRKACIALFMFLGPQHELTLKHRRMFDMVLY